jgi:hypothetical protein
MNMPRIEPLPHGSVSELAEVLESSKNRSGCEPSRVSSDYDQALN